ncbi:MAG: hypothetical protein K8R92_04940 [Planctomycetes bacterium]|nr:hypothetical protein [Planctomycetota bacterium]
MRATASIVSTLAAVSIAGIANANLLVNPGFEVNSTTSYVNVLTNFTGFQGIWGPEVGTITGPNGGVIPAGGVQMMKLDDDGLSYTQCFQTTDVSSYSASINAGIAQATLQALFTTGQTLNGSIAAVSLQFFGGASYGTQIGTGISFAMPLDGSAATWQNVLVTGMIPVGTTWILSQVMYNNASLLASDGVVYSGYVDDADLDIRLVPAPGAFGLVTLAGAFAARRRRVN